MAHRDVQERLLPSAFISSYVDRCRPGELLQADHAARAAAWAQWSIGALVEMSGLEDRTYVALTLPGSFYNPDPRTSPDSLRHQVRPHLEIRASLLDRPAPDFPDRLALAGNGLAFPQWTFPEVTAARRALLNVEWGDLSPVLRALVASRDALASAVTTLSARLVRHWSVIQGLLVTAPESLVPSATGDFSLDDAASLWTPARSLGISVTFDSKLREKAGARAARNIGIWQVRLPGASFGVITPRLTRNSLFSDAMFSPQTESAAALLVRALILSRLLQRHVTESFEPPVVGPAQRERRATSFLRAQPARPGARLPEPSVEGAIAFLQEYPDSGDAWSLLAAWAERTRALLTVSEEGFRASHANALRYLRRAEDPERDDINVVLPLAWSADNQVVRVTFTRAPATDAD